MIFPHRMGHNQDYKPKEKAGRQLAPRLLSLCDNLYFWFGKNLKKLLAFLEAALLCIWPVASYHGGSDKSPSVFFTAKRAG